MFGISFEHLLIAFVILLIFGPTKLPALGRALGKTVRNFKEHLNGIKEPEYKILSEEREPASDAKKGGPRNVS
jgi:sec-independent protein translocase protein TatA